MSLEAPKRTRSQLTVSDRILQLPLYRSPLKDARVALRNQNSVSSMDNQDETDDEILLSPTKNKRSQSTFPEDVHGHRESKRVRRDPLPALRLVSKDADVDTENEGSSTQSNQKTRRSKRHANRTATTSKKPVSSSAAVQGNKKAVSSVFPPRAQSVPLASGVPHLDLKTIVASPSRSPGKLHIAPTPHLDAIPDVNVDSSSPIDKSDTNAIGDVDAGMDVDMSHLAPIPDTPGHPVKLSPAMMNVVETPRVGYSSAFSSPLSPLTPLPSTPSSIVTPDVEETVAIPDLPSQLARSLNQLFRAAEVDSSTTNGEITADRPTYPPASAATPVVAPVSRLPRPSGSMLPPPVPANRARSATVNVATKGKKPVSAQKTNGRITRSSSLKQRGKVSQLDDDSVRGTVAESVESKVTSGGKAASSKDPEATMPISVTSKPPQGAGRMGHKKSSSLSDKASNGKMKQSSLLSLWSAKQPSTSTTKAAVTTSTSKPSSPTKSRPSSPVKPSLLPRISSPTKISKKWSSSNDVSTGRSTSGTTSSRMTSSSFDILGSFSGSKKSLKTLSSALEKLNLPPPSRPNTSLGFNRSTAEDEESEGEGPSAAKDDSMISHGSLQTRHPPLKRAATTGTDSSSGPNAHAQPISSIFPPFGEVAARSAEVRKPTVATSIIGRMKGKDGKPSPKAAKIFGAGSGRMGTGIFKSIGIGASKIAPKASRKTSLPSVEASPVKGGGSFDFASTGSDEAAAAQGSGTGTSSHIPLRIMDLVVDINTSGEVEKPVEDMEGVEDDKGTSKEKEKRSTEWRINASQRATMASQALSQSLSSLPQTPPPPTRVPTRTGLRSASSSYPTGTQGAVAKGKGKEKEDLEAPKNALGVPTRGASDRAGTAQNSPSEVEGSGGKKSSLKVLKNCTIFVDVRTDDGDSAGGLFVDMLRGLGARILTRVGQSCTHIVYKNGLMSTLTRYRLLNDPKPHVVGIAWVVECVEQRSRIDEEKYKVDLDSINVAGTNKRRRSMLPKHMSPMEDDFDRAPASSEQDRDDADQADLSMESTSPSMPLKDNDLAPLEKARRRSMFMGRP